MYIKLRNRGCDITVLNMSGATEDKTDDMTDGFAKNYGLYLTNL